MPLRVSCPGPLLRLACLGGGGPVPVPPYLAWGCAPPMGRVRGVRVPGGGLRWGGGPCAVPPVCAAGEATRAGGRSASFRPSAFPGQATKRLSLASFWSWEAWPPYCSGSCSPAFSGRNLCGVLARWRGLACSPRFLSEPAAGAGGRAVFRLLSRAGGGGTTPPASGGWGPAPPQLAGRWGGWGGGRAAASLVHLWGEARSSLPWPPSCRGRTPLRRARSVGVARPPPGGGGDEGRPVDRSPGGPFRPEPSLCPPRGGNGHGGGHGGRGPLTVLVCRRVPPPGLVRAPLRRACVGSPLGRAPPGAGGSRRWGARCAGPAASPPPSSRSLLGEGGRPLGSGGAEGRSCGPQAGGGSGGGGVGGPLRRPPPSLPGRASACHQLSPACPPGVYSCRGGCRATVGVSRGPVGRQWVSAAGGGRKGGETPPPWFVPPPSRGRPLKGPLRLRRPGRAGGSRGALAAAAVPLHPRCSSLLKGGAGPPSLRSASIRSWA